MIFFIKILSLFYSTIVIVLLFLYQTHSDVIKSVFFEKKNIKNISRNMPNTQLKHFQKINKTDMQIKFDKYTTIGVNILQITPFAVAVTTYNPIMYLTYASAITISTPIVAFGKKIVKEPRPDDKNDLTSFPSGHSVFAFMASTVLVLCLKKQKNKKILGLISITIALFVAIGRVIAKRHWFIDIFFGSIFGLIVGIISFFLIKKINDRFCLFDNKFSKL